MSQIVKEGDNWLIIGQQDDLIIKNQSKLNEGAEQKDNIDYSSIPADQAMRKLKDNQNQVSFYKENPQRLGIIETPQEKLNRLQSELLEFKEQVIFLENQNKNVQQQMQDNQNTTILKEVETLQRQLVNIQEMEGVKYLLNNDTLQEYSMPYNLSFLQKDVQQKVTQNLINNIELINQEAQLSQQQAKPQKEPTKMEIYIDNQLSQLDESQKYIELEKRIDQLEKMLGQDKLNSKSAGALNQQNENLIQKVDFIQTNVKIMQSQKLEEIQKKIQDLAINLDTTLKKKTDSQLNQEEIKRIYDMYERLNQVIGVVDELPCLVDRLESLQELHEESAGFLVNMNNLVKIHNQIIEQFDKNDQTMTQIQSSLDNNLQTMKNNFKNLEERIEKLEQKK